MNIKKYVAAIVLLLLLAGSGVATAKSKIWDLIFEEEQTTGQPAPQAPAPTGQAAAYTVEIKMSNGETFRTETSDPDVDEVEFIGTMKIEREDGTYYLNSAQVQYIRVAAQ